MHVARRIQCEGGHEGSFAANHARLHGVPSILRAMDKCCQLRDFSLSILQWIGSKITHHLHMVSDNGTRLRGSSRAVGKPLNPNANFLDALKNGDQRLLLSEAISKALARHLKHPVEGLPRRFVRQTAAQVCATQVKKSPAQLFPVVSCGKPFLLRELVDEGCTLPF